MIGLIAFRCQTRIKQNVRIFFVIDVPHLAVLLNIVLDIACQFSEFRTCQICFAVFYKNILHVIEQQGEIMHLP